MNKLRFWPPTLVTWPPSAAAEGGRHPQFGAPTVRAAASLAPTLVEGTPKKIHLGDELRRIWAGTQPGCCTRYIEAGCEADVCPVDTLNW